MDPMRNPLSLLPKPRTPRIAAEATVPVASKWRHPTTSVNLFTRTDAANQLDTMRSSSVVYSITHRISSDVARQQWQIVNTATDTTVDEHPFLWLWGAPNERMTPTGRAFRQLAGTYLELLGEACILVVSVGNKPRSQPVELWPLRPDRLTPVPDPYNWLAGWIYTSEDGERVPLRPDQIIQLKYPDPADPCRGLSPLRAALVDVDSVGFASELQRQLFLNGALPGGLLTTDAELTPSEFKEWLERWNEQHQGVDNAGRVSLMDHGAKFIQQQMSMVDLALAELVETNQGNIREAWGISKTMLGQSEDVNRATAEAAEYVYGKYTLADRVDLWAEAGNELLRRYPSSGARPGLPARLRLEIAGELSPADVETDAKDRDSRVDAVVKFVKAGGDPAAVLELFGFPADLDWDTSRALPDPGLPELTGVGGRFHPKALEAATQRPAIALQLDDADLPDVSRLEDDFQAILIALLAAWATLEAGQKEAIIAAVVALAATGSLSDLTRIQIDSSAAANELESAMGDVAERAAEAVVDEAAEQGTEIRPVVPHRGLMRDVAVVTAAMLARRLVSGAIGAAMRANGPDVTPGEIEDAVTDHLNGLSADGPRPMLSGALTGAQNDARVATVEAAPLVGDVFASEQNDSNTCGPCRRIHGTWLGTTNEMAEVRRHYPGGAFGGYKDCEGRERCRGTIVVVWPDDG